MRFRPEEIVLVAVSGLMAVQHRRMLFLFGIVAAPVVCRLLAGLWETYDSKRDLASANAVCIAIAVATVVLAFPSHAELTKRVNEGNPQAAAAFVREAHLSGPMLNDYGFGGFLIWALPEHKVFVDGRGSDIFEWDQILGPLRQWSYLSEDPQVLLNKYNIRFCILNTDSPLSRVVPYLPGWQKVYGDPRACVFVRKGL